MSAEWPYIEGEDYRARYERIAREGHDDGAADALLIAYETETVGQGYMAYDRFDIDSTLEGLAVNGWRLVRVSAPSDETRADASARTPQKEGPANV